MAFHPIAGILGPGAGPVLADPPPVSSCAFEYHGRFASRVCNSGEATHIVYGRGIPDGYEPLLCDPHADMWARTDDATGGHVKVVSFDSIEVGP